MEYFNKKFKSAEKAVATLEDALNAKYSVYVRDSAIQRFEYTTEALWKCLQIYLKEYEGIISASPKACMREAKKLGILNDEEAKLAIEMIDDRNLTSHTYHEEIAERLFKHLPKYAELMKKILKKIDVSRKMNDF